MTWTLLSIVLVGIAGDGFFAALSAKVPGGGLTPGTHPSLYFLSIAAGVWATWLYAVIRPHYRSTIRAGVVAGVAWWIIMSLQSMKWVVMLKIPAAAWLPLTANLFLCVAATLCGAGLYGNVPARPPFNSTPDRSAPAVT